MEMNRRERIVQSIKEYAAIFLVSFIVAEVAIAIWHIIRHST